MEIRLNGALMTDKASAHEYLKQQLELPDYYGRNLDALYDLLTEYREPLVICVNAWSALEQNLGHYAAALLDTLYDAAKANHNLTIIVKNADA